MSGRLRFWGWMVAAALAVACRAAAPLTSESDEGAVDAASGAAAEREPTRESGGRSSGAVAAASGAPADDGAAGTATESPADGCGAQAITLAEVHSGRVRFGIRVALEPLVASSQKFLVSEAKSGSCLWGAMAAHPTDVGRGSGLFLVAFGAPHAEGEACASGSDGLPDDLAPGDRLLVEGTIDAYAPAACDAAPALQLRLEPGCAARRDGRVDPPTAAVIDRETADQLAQGTDAALLRDWGGALARLENVSAQPDPDDGDSVWPFGVMRLNETALEVHSRIYYFDLSGGGPRATTKAPRFRSPLTLEQVTGHVFLDYCTWSLAPRSACADLEPASEACAPSPSAR